VVPRRNALLGLEGTESWDADEGGEEGEGPKAEGGDEVLDGPGPGLGLGLWQGDICGGRVEDEDAGEGAWHVDIATRVKEIATANMARVSAMVTESREQRIQSHGTWLLYL